MVTLIIKTRLLDQHTRGFWVFSFIAVQRETTTKLEKAEILDLAVDYLKKTSEDAAKYQTPKSKHWLQRTLLFWESIVLDKFEQKKGSENKRSKWTSDKWATGTAFPTFHAILSSSKASILKTKPGYGSFPTCNASTRPSCEFTFIYFALFKKPDESITFSSIG